tara:strand:- start:13318 stop:13542 length:225 start_codon:yes stop_codon:yes gene_type:complete
MEKEFMIYESPDKGNTIYRRKPGSAERELIKKQPDKHKIISLIDDIEIASNSDKALRDMLDKLVVYWSLRNANN